MASPQPRVLLIDGSARTDPSSPGEMSKSYRLALVAERALRSSGLRGRLGLAAGVCVMCSGRWPEPDEGLCPAPK